MQVDPRQLDYLAGQVETLSKENATLEAENARLRKVDEAAWNEGWYDYSQKSRSMIMSVAWERSKTRKALAGLRRAVEDK